MAKKNWLTSFTGANPVQDPDPVTDVMPDLDDVSAPGAGDGDDALSSHVEKLRDKLDTLCKLVGDSLNLPSGTIADILDRDHTYGDARWLRMRKRSSDPTPEADNSYIFAFEDGGVTKGYVLWSDGTKKEIGIDTGGQTDTVSGSNGITNTGDNVDAVLEPTYGSSLNTICQGNDSRLSDARTPTSHATSHKSGGSDSVKLDEFASPDDNTNLDVSTVTHGLCPKLSGVASDGLKGDGSWGTVTPLTTKGDLYGFSTVPDRHPVGANEQRLISDSTTSTGLSWANEQKAHEQFYVGSSSGNIDIHLNYVPHGAGALDTLSGYSIMAFRDGSKMTYAATPSASDEYWYNSSTNEVRVVGDGSSHRWEFWYTSAEQSEHIAGGSTLGTATFGTDTFDG